MTLVEHIGELRRRLIITFVAVLVGAVVCWIFYFDILDFLVQPYCDLVDSGEVGDRPGNNCSLFVTDPTRALQGSPDGCRLRRHRPGHPDNSLAVLALHIVPALYPHERRYAALFVAGGTMLFLLGAALAYWSIPRAPGLPGDHRRRGPGFHNLTGGLSRFHCEDDGGVRSRLRVPDRAHLSAIGGPGPITRPFGRVVTTPSSGSSSWSP